MRLPERGTVKKIFFFVFAFLLLFPKPALAATDLSSSEGTWDSLNPPQWAKDLRRAEIITLGSLPFVTIWTTLGYSLAVLGEFHNPLDKSTDGFEESDQMNIIKLSAATCLGLGIFDLGFNLVKRSVVKNRSKKNAGSALEVLPFSVQQREHDDLNPPPLQKQEYFECGVESAIF